MILGAVSELTHEVAQVRLASFSAGDIDCGAGQADRRAGRVAQWLNMHVVPQGMGAIANAEFPVSGLAGLDHFALQRDNGSATLGRQQFLIQSTDDVIGRPPEHGIRN
jgi:hypothetical protein